MLTKRASLPRSSTVFRAPVRSVCTTIRACSQSVPRPDTAFTICDRQQQRVSSRQELSPEYGFSFFDRNQLFRRSPGGLTSCDTDGTRGRHNRRRDASRRPDSLNNGGNRTRGALRLRGR